MNPICGQKTDIILIGPCGSGKSTVARLLADKLRIPNVSMDDLCQRYYAEAPKQEAAPSSVESDAGFPRGWIEGRWKDAYAVGRLLFEHANCVFDFGAGHSVYEDRNLFIRVQQLLEPYINVVLLMPTSDPDESIRILRERTLKAKNWDCVVQGFDFHDHFVRHHSNYDLARYRVHTLDKSPEQTRDAILALTGSK